MVEVPQSPAPEQQELTPPAAVEPPPPDKTIQQPYSITAPSADWELSAGHPPDSSMTLEPPSSDLSSLEPPTTTNLEPCPKCQAILTVNTTDVGLHVQCPLCETIFVGMAADSPVDAEVPDVAEAPAEEEIPVAEFCTEEVDIQPCPNCRAELMIEATYLEEDIECPRCQTVYRAKLAPPAQAPPRAPAILKPVKKASRRPEDDADRTRGWKRKRK